MAAVRLLLAGDVMTGRGIDQVLPRPGAPALFESWVRDARDYVRLAQEANGPIAAPVSPAYIWGDALAEMARMAPDLRIANLETAVTGDGSPWPGKGIHYRMHPDNVACLTVARLDACSLANNHVLDWGHDGLAQTQATLAAVGIRTAGAGASRAEAWAPAVMRLRGGARLLLLAFATPSSGVPDDWAASGSMPGVALLPELSAAALEEVAQASARLRRPGDLVVVSLHWGGNWGLAVPAEHRRFARALVDRGAADVVHGHSSHHPLPIEVYRGKPILYGCGDLLNDYEGIGPHGSLHSDFACLYALTLEDAVLQQLEIVPLRIRRFRLERADPPARAWLRSVFAAGGAPFGSAIAPGDAGSFFLRWN